MLKAGRPGCEMLLDLCTLCVFVFIASLSFPLCLSMEHDVNEGVSSIKVEEGGGYPCELPGGWGMAELWGH